MDNGNESDEILLLSLKELGLQSLDDSVKTIGSLDASMLVEVIAKSLLKISNGEVEFSDKLPPNVASRHRICTNMSLKLKEIGYPFDCGYNQLLYPSEKSTKDLLTWLVQHLPRSEEEMTEEVLGANALLNKKILDSLYEWVHSMRYLPFCGTGSPYRNFYTTNNLVTIVSDGTKDDIRKLYNACHQENIDAVSSIFERHTFELVSDAKIALKLEEDLATMDGSDNADKTNINNTIKDALSSAKRLFQNKDDDKGSRLSKFKSDLLNGEERNLHGRNSRFVNATEFAQDKQGLIGKNGERIDEQLKNKDNGDYMDGEGGGKAKNDKEHEEEIQNARSKIESTLSNIDNLGVFKSNSTSRIRQLESELKLLETDYDSLDKEVKIKRKALEMLPKAKENIGKLENVCNESSQRLLRLAEEWETHRIPLMDQLRLAKSGRGVRKLKCRQMVDEMRQNRADMVNMIQELKDKQEKAEMLAEELKKLPKNINRALYTQRIMDIIASLSKSTPPLALFDSLSSFDQQSIRSFFYYLEYLPAHHFYLSISNYHSFLY